MTHQNPNQQQTIAQLVEKTGNSSIVAQLEAMLAIAKRAGLNIELLEMSCATQFARVIVEFAEQLGRTPQLVPAMEERSASSQPLDYSKFGPDYMRRCRGLAAGGAMYLGRQS